MIIKLKGREIDVRIEEKSIKIVDDKNEIEMTKDEFMFMAGMFLDSVKAKFFKKG
jgi:hypothetical protein